MTRICNFPTSRSKRCKQPVTDDKPNCGRHKTSLDTEQCGQHPNVYQKDGVLHIWTGNPDRFYCLIHSDPAYQVLCQLAGETPPCCLQKGISWKDEDGQWHQDDGPAIIDADGTQWWYQHGRLHRDDGPAVIRPDGMQEWYQHGKLHRDDGPAWVWPDGTQYWHQHGELHREDGPAVIEADGTRRWYQHNERHREDGPAIIWADGTQEWWWHGSEVTEEEHARLRKQSRGV